MVRCHQKVWEHFVKVEKLPKNQYYYVQYKYCENEGMDAPFEGHICSMERHLNTCTAYNNGLEHPTNASYTSIGRRNEREFH